MKIKHYRAADMRQALRQVRDAQGPDAVILSSRRIAAASKSSPLSTTTSKPKRAVAASEPVATPNRASRRPPTTRPLAHSAFSGGQDRHTKSVTYHADVNEELRTLRRMLETQLATLAWNDLSRRAPIQTELLSS